ncbi:MAG: hypothetical protein ACTS3F_01075 [Phycisphaerales bacterium]
MTGTGGNPDDPRNEGGLGDGGRGPGAGEADGTDAHSAALMLAARRESEEDERECERLLGELEAAKARVSEVEAGMAQAERRHALDLLLVRSGTVDLEAARMLIEPLLDEHGDDAGAAVAALITSKPYLFHAPAGGAPAPVDAPGAMPPEPEPLEGDEGLRLLELAERAAERGDRAGVLRYLAARRRK